MRRENNKLLMVVSVLSEHVNHVSLGVRRVHLLVYMNRHVDSCVSQIGKMIGKLIKVDEDSVDNSSSME